jgi:transaldolase
MALYLDSALISEAETARDLGWVTGITTNPTLLSKSDLPPETTLKRLASLIDGEVFYQLTASDLDGMLAEAQLVHRILGEQTVLKIPATSRGFQALARLSKEIPSSVTAIFHPAQALVARAAGARYAIAYVNRTTRLLGDGVGFVREMAELLKGSQTRILAASIKSPQEAVATINAGAHVLTLPLDVLESLTSHPISEKTILDFNHNGRGLQP